MTTTATASGPRMHARGRDTGDSQLASAALAKALATSDASVDITPVKVQFEEMRRSIPTDVEAQAILTDGFINRKSQIDVPTVAKLFGVMTTVDNVDAVSAALLTSTWARSDSTVTASAIVERFGRFQSWVNDPRAAAQLTLVYYTSPSNVYLQDILDKYAFFQRELSVGPLPAAMMTEAWANSDWQFNVDTLGAHFYRLRDNAKSTDEVGAQLVTGYATTPRPAQREHLFGNYQRFLSVVG